MPRSPTYAADVTYNTTLATGRSNDIRIQMWISRRMRAQQFKQLFESEWIKYWRWYRNWVTPLADPADWWRSNEVIPTTFKIIETLLPRQIIGMFDSPEWFNVETRQARDEGYERLCESLLRASVEDMHIFPKMFEAMKYMLIMGHCWGKVVWREEYTTRQVLVPQVLQDPMTGEPLYGVTSQVVTEESFNGVDFEWRPLDRIFPDPTGEGDWYIEEIETTLERLEEVQDQLGVYDNEQFEALKYSIPPTRIPYNEDALGNMRQGTSGGVQVEYAREPQVTEGIPLQYVTPMRDGTGVKLWQCWGYVPKPLRSKDGAAWRMAVIADGKYVLRDEPSPTPDGRPPYFPMKSIPIPGRLYGESILKYIGPLNDQQTRLSNMRMDEVFLGVWQQYLYRRNAVVSDNQMLMQPGGAIEVQPEPGQSVNDVFTILPRKPVMPDAYTEDQYRQTQAEYAAAASDIMQGVSAQDRQTATEVERRLQQGNARHMLYTMWNDYTIKKELLERTWRWLQMRLTAPKIVRIAGEEWAQIDLTQIQIPIDIIVAGGMFALSKESRVQMDQELVQLSSSPIFVQYMKPDAILQKLLEDRGWKNVQKYIKTQQELMLEQLQQQFMAAQAGQMGGPGGEQAGGGPGGGAPGQGSVPQGGAAGQDVQAMPPPGMGASMAGGLLEQGGPPMGG